MVGLEIVLPFFATVFAYLSWKNSTTKNQYELESTLRERLRESVGSTDFYVYQLAQLHMSTYGGVGYDIWKYLPIVGGIKGQTVVYLYFSSPDGKRQAIVPILDEIKNHEHFERTNIEVMNELEDVEMRPDGDRNFEMVFDTVDPDTVLKGIRELSHTMLKINRNKDLTTTNNLEEQ